MSDEKGNGTKALEAMSPEREKANLAFKKAQMFAKSNLLPEHFRGKPEDVLLAMELAERLDVAPLAVMQKTFMVKGRPGFMTEFVIGLCNQRGPYKGGLRYEVEGVGDEMRVRAWSMLRETGERVDGSWVSMAMAKAEGWTSNAKYKSMPEHMLRYRAAAFLIRQSCPEVMMGFPTVEELEDLSAARETFYETVDTKTGEIAAPQAQTVDELLGEPAAHPLEPVPIEREVADMFGSGE